MTPKGVLKAKVWHEYEPRTDRVSGAGKKRERWSEIAELTNKRREERRQGIFETQPRTMRGKNALRPKRVWS